MGIWLWGDCPQGRDFDHTWCSRGGEFWHVATLISWLESGERGEDLEMTYLGKYPESIWLNFPPSCQSNGWTKGEWYMDLVASKETMSFLTPVSYLSLKVYNTMFFQFIIYKSLLPAWHHFNRCSALSLWHKKQKICVFLNVEWFVPGSCQIWWKLESYPMVSILNLKPKSWLKS